MYVDGRVSALLELGAGFNPEFTGRDNVYLNAAILGLSQQGDRRASSREIEEFAEIGEFIDQPVKTYSSGMVVRLAFAVAIHVDPEILLVDEALSVGDIYFRQRCMRKVHELRARGVTILFVSHAIAEVKAHRRPRDVAGRRPHQGNRRHRRGGHALPGGHGGEGQRLPGERRTARRKRAARARCKRRRSSTRIPNIDHRFGDGRAEVLGIAVLDAAGQPVYVLEPLHDHRGAHQRAGAWRISRCPSWDS